PTAPPVFAAHDDPTMQADAVPPASTPPPIATPGAALATPRAGVRVLNQEVSVRDLSPVRRAAAPRPLMVPSAPPARPGAGQLVPPPLPRPSTNMTPTPLPSPMPYHEAPDS